MTSPSSRSNVVSLNDRSPGGQALHRAQQDKAQHAQRAAVLFGQAPMFTFDLEELCLSVRLVSADGARWLGLVADKAAFTDRARLAGGHVVAPFVVHANASTPTVCGDAQVSLLGRVGAGGEAPEDLEPALKSAAHAVIASAPFGAHGQVLIAVEPGTVRVDDGETPAHGAVPRT